MPLAITETTTPATADCGMREFVIALDEFTEITLVASYRQDESAPGEGIHLRDASEPVSNHNLSLALIQLASRTVSRVGHSIISA